MTGCPRSRRYREYGGAHGESLCAMSATRIVSRSILNPGSLRTSSVYLKPTGAANRFAEESPAFRDRRPRTF